MTGKLFRQSDFRPVFANFQIMINPSKCLSIYTLQQGAIVIVINRTAGLVIGAASNFELEGIVNSWLQ